MFSYPVKIIIEPINMLWKFQSTNAKRSTYLLWSDLAIYERRKNYLSGANANPTSSSLNIYAKRSRN